MRKVKTIDFCDVANENGIEIIEFPLPETGSVSLQMGKREVIGIDDAGNMTEGERQAHLGHECGHCLFGGFYNRYSAYDVVERHEVKADRWYIKKAIPKRVLFAMLRDGYDAYEIAEVLNTTEEYVRRAYYFYKENEMGGAAWH